MPSKIVDQARAIVRQAEDDPLVVVDTTGPTFTMTLPRPNAERAEKIRNLYLAALAKHLDAGPARHQPTPTELGPDWYFKLYNTMRDKGGAHR
jgi:hypothetical protein